jgi:uncharacterized membrane protein
VELSDISLIYRARATLFSDFENWKNMEKRSLAVRPNLNTIFEEVHSSTVNTSWSNYINSKTLVIIESKEALSKQREEKSDSTKYVQVFEKHEIWN